MTYEEKIELLRSKMAALRFSEAWQFWIIINCDESRVDGLLDIFSDVHPDQHRRMAWRHE